VLTLSADAARLALPGVASFGVACAAVEALTRTLAAELGPSGVRVVCLRSSGSPELASDRASALTAAVVNVACAVIAD
jgi:enoyl-[acyl-carrier-protein] reductase (NADH)